MKQKHRINKKEAEQLRALKIEVDTLPLKPASAKRQIVVDWYKDYSVNPKGTPKSIIGYESEEHAAAKAERQLEKMLRKKRRQLLDQITAFEEWLDNVQDPQIRAILRLHYRDGLSQSEIGDQLGYTQARVSQLINDFWRYGSKG